MMELPAAIVIEFRAGFGENKTGEPEGERCIPEVFCFFGASAGEGGQQ